MIRVRLKDFQTYRETELEIEGFTSVTGPNNGGKSALARALRCAFQNIPAAHFIRHGQGQTEVEVGFDSGAFRWGRKAGPTGRPFYQVGSQLVHPGRDVPDVIRDFGVRSVEIGGDSVWPQFGRQGDPAFLLDRSGAVLAEAVCDPGRADQLNRMGKLLESDRKTVRSRLTLIQERLGENRRREAFLQPVRDEIGRVESSLPKVESLLENLTRRVETFQHVQSRMRDLTGILLGFRDIQNQPFLTDPNQIRVTLERLRGIQSVEGRLSRVQAQLGRFAPLKGTLALPPQPDMDKLGASISYLRDLRGCNQRWKTLSEQLHRFQKVKSQPLNPWGQVQDHIARLSWVKAQRSKLAEIGTKLTDLKQAQLALQAKQDQVQKERGALLAQITSCPFCGSDPNDML